MHLWMRPGDSDEQNQRAREAYGALKIVSLSRTNNAQYTMVEQKVRTSCNMMCSYLFSVVSAIFSLHKNNASL
jgi:hypothetical protein